MTVQIANIDYTTNNWLDLINRVSLIANTISTKVVTVNSNTSTGNSAITGTFTANILLANTANVTFQTSNNIVSNGLVSNTATFNVSVTTTGNVVTLTSNSVTTNALAATTGNVVTLSSNTATLNVATITTGNVVTLTSNAATINVATVTTGNVVTLTSNTSTINVATVTTGNVRTLTSNAATINVLVATSGNVVTLTSNAITANVTTTKTFNANGDMMNSDGTVQHYVSSIFGGTTIYTGTFSNHPVVQLVNNAGVGTWNANGLNTIIGATTPANGSFVQVVANNLVTNTLTANGGGSLTGPWTSMGNVAAIDINGGSIDGTPIGQATPASADFTTLDVSGASALHALSATAITCTTVAASGSITGDSDGRLKKNVRTITGALEKILKARGVYYQMINEGPYAEDNIGVIAQELEAAGLGEMVKTRGKGKEKFLAVAYGNSFGVTIEAFRDVVDMILERDELIAALTARVEALEKA